MNVQKSLDPLTQCRIATANLIQVHFPRGGRVDRSCNREDRFFIKLSGSHGRAHSHQANSIVAYISVREFSADPLTIC